MDVGQTVPDAVNDQELRETGSDHEHCASDNHSTHDTHGTNRVAGAFSSNVDAQRAPITKKHSGEVNEVESHSSKVQMPQQIEGADASFKVNKANDKADTLAEALDSQSNKCILSPLCFPEPELRNKSGRAQDRKKVSFDHEYEANFKPEETPCLLCEEIYRGIEEKPENDEYLCHLIVEHKLVIADVKLIADLRKYSIYWKKRFQEKKIEEFCAVIKTNSSEKDKHPSEKYFLLCDAVAEDRMVREELQLIRLKKLVAVQAKERENAEFEKMCLFCTKFFIGNRNDLFTHMNEDHNFNVGHPHNLVFVDEFLKEIEQKLAKFECLFCDKVFKDRASLIEHMRKKSHRRLNPKNKSYDKYYIINYLELGKNWEILQGEPDHLESGEDWSGWEDEVGMTAVCFFCSSQFSTHEKVFEHMASTHDFDFVAIRKEMNLSFYQQIKMVNYIRRTVHQIRESDKEKDGNEAKELSPGIAEKYAEAIKNCISSSTKWNQPQYYFPTYENDTLLCQLEDREGLIEPEDNFIIGEDGIDCKAIINESILTDLVVHGYFD